MSEPFKDPQHLANTADAMGRSCKSWQSSTAKYHFAVRDMIREQADRIEDLQAENERLREACNQSRLAFAGHVSVQSALDKLDALGDDT